MPDPLIQRLFENGEKHIEQYGDVGCGAHAWLKENLLTASFQDYLNLVSSNLDWGPGVCAQMFTLGSLYHEGEALASLQKTYGEILLKYPFEFSRGRIEKILLTVSPLEPSVKDSFIEVIKASHLNPEEFLARVP